MSKRNNKIILPAIAIGSLASVGVLSTMLFPASGVNAESSAGAEIGTTISGFIRLALDTDDVALKDGENTIITPSASGTLATGDVNVAVTTNTESGFSISVYTQDASTAMTHSNPNVSATIPSVSGATGYDATTGISDLASNTWGFRKKTGESEGTPTYGNWFGVGADETHGTVIENSNSSSSEYCATLAYPLASSGCNVGTYAEHTLNFGANLTSALPSGTYTNNVVISAVAKSEGQKYSVSFNSNGGNNTAGSRTIVAGSTFTMPTITNVTKPGYEIAGYAFTSDAASATYTPGQTVTVADFLAAATAAGQTPDSGITLYLLWEKPTMQTFSCSSLSANEIATLVDSRDNHEYKVKKLPDGKCWMIQNLTLSATDLVTEGKALTSANTNIPSSDTNSYYVPPRNTRYDTDDDDASSITNSAVATASTKVGFYPDVSNHPQVAYKAKGDTNHDTGNALPEDTAWYSFYTATLGFSYNGDGKSSGSSPRDICPKGWRLPKVSDNGTSVVAASSEFANLARTYNSSASWGGSDTAYNYYTTDATIRKNMILGDSSSLDPTLEDNGAAGFTYAGLYDGATLYNVGTRGFYWSSSVYSNDGYYNNYDYCLSFINTPYVRPQDYVDIYSGLAVRCVTE